MQKNWLSRFVIRLMKKYRLVLYDEELLSTSRELAFRPLSGIGMGLVIMLIFCALTTAMIFYIPLFRQMVPGYTNHLSEEYKNLQAQNTALEHQVVELDSMLSVLSTVMGSNHSGGQSVSLNQAITEPENNTDTISGQVMDENFSTVSNVVSETVDKQRDERKPQYSYHSEIPNLLPPVDGYVMMGYDVNEKEHYGVDLVADENSLIRAVADGIVIFSEYSSTTGYVVGIWHSQHNLVSFYKHNSKVFKQEGSYVFGGEAIAVIGNTGINSTGTHLHFELWYNNNPVNPMDYIIFN